MNKNDLYSTFEKYKFEIITFIIFCVGVIFVTIFHEPWYDEFESWQISKSSLKDILFYIPHIEGHPPLWHLILKCFSIFNFNPEVGIRIPNLLFIFSAVWLVIFKSPFPKFIKFLLPFTYFFFYQFGVISRPYSILCFAILLTAYFYKTRNEKPFHFVGAMILLCFSSIYGMLISFGICLVWLFEILRELFIDKVLKNLFRDNRIKSLIIIFLSCCFIAFEILPVERIEIQGYFAHAAPILKFLYYIFILPADATITNVMHYYPSIKIPLWHYMLGFIIGGYFTILMYSVFFKTKIFGQFLLTYFPFLIFAFLFYLYPHHIGILTMIILYNLWLLFDNVENIPHRSQLSFFILLTLSIQIYWSFYASYMDIHANYACSRPLANYIKEHNLQKHKIFASWEVQKLYIYENSRLVPAYYSNTNDIYIAVLVNPYFNKNIIANFNVNNKDKLYQINLQNKESEKVHKMWKDIGEPDVIISDSSDVAYFDAIFNNNFIKRFPNEYTAIHKVFYSICWKTDFVEHSFDIFAKKELLP